MTSLLLLPGAAGAVSAPAGFVVENAVPGVAFEAPTAVAFLPDGRMLVAEKAGRVWIVAGGVRSPTPLLALESEVLDNTDQGLTGLAVDPAFATNQRLYLLYSVDPDSNGVDDNLGSFGRLARYQLAADGNSLQPGSRAILLGTSWRDGPVCTAGSHTIGDLEWGRDGTLLVGAGDGADFQVADAGGRQPGVFGPGRADPNEDIGAFRAQDLNSLAGKILRIDPATGWGLAGNPYWDGNPASVRSRVWAYGLRNPFRFTVRPGSGATNPALADPGTLVIGDVGWNSFEEIDVARGGGLDFGWPCYEGFDSQGGYQGAHPAHHGCGTMGTASNPAPHTPPIASWHHANGAQSVPPGPVGNCVIGGVFYGGTRFPAAYRGAFFYADYGLNWIRIARLDANGALLGIDAFATDAEGPVCFRSEPASGDLIYAAINVGEVKRIRYGAAPGNAPPVAVATGSPRSGAAPLSVAFSSSGTSDPDGDPVDTNWMFGDGQGSSEAAPTHVYGAAGVWTAVLTASDGRGGVGRDTVTITVTGGTANSRPTAIITAPRDGSFYVKDVGVPLEGTASDAEQSAGTLGYQWVVDLHHDQHVHPSAFSATGPSATLMPADHEDGRGLHYEVALRVTDAGGLRDTARVSIWPEVDLVAGPITVDPAEPGTDGPARVAFTIRNDGRMRAPSTRWRLVAGTTRLAEGDTLVEALGAVEIALTLPPMLPAGDYPLRLTVDTLETAPETSESNNARTRALTVVEGEGRDGVPPTGPVSLGIASPNPSGGSVGLAIDLQAAATVRFEVHDLQGRGVWRAGDATLPAGRSMLEWPGVRNTGEPVPSGVYVVRVAVGNGHWERRVALVR